MKTGKIEIHFVKEGMIITPFSTADDVYDYRMLIAEAERFSAELSNMTKKAMQTMRENGFYKYLFCPQCGGYRTREENGVEKVREALKTLKNMPKSSKYWIINPMSCIFIFNERSLSHSSGTKFIGLPCLPRFYSAIVHRG